MAVTVTELVDYTTTDNGTSYTSSSYAPTASRGLVACIFAAATDHNLTPTVTGNGVTWELIDDAARGAHAMWIFASYSGSSPTTTGLSVEINPADPATGCIIWVGELAGTDATPSLFLTQFAHDDFGASVTPAVAFSATADAACTALGFLGTLLNPPTTTPPTSWTEVSDTGITNPTVGTSVAYYASFGANTTVTWGSAPSTVSTLMIVEIAAAAAGSTTATAGTVAAVAAVAGASVTATTRPSMTTVAATVAIATPRVSTGAASGTPTRDAKKKPKRGFVYEGYVSRHKDAPRWP